MPDARVPGVGTVIAIVVLVLPDIHRALLMVTPVYKAGVEEGISMVPY